MIHPRGGVATKPVAVLWFHGNTSRFYDLPYIHIGTELAKLGYSFLTCNTHGHDIISPIWGPDGDLTPGGALMERFSEVPLDLDPWISCALSCGFGRVALVGHSFGAAKVIYYQVHTNDPRVLGVIAASPDLRWRTEPDRLALAESMVSDGRGDELLPPTEGNPPWFRMCARTLVERARIARNVYQADDGEQPHIARLASPLLAYFGTEEPWMGAEAQLQAVRDRAVASPHVDTHMLEGADHVYRGKAPEAARLIADWVDGLLAEHGGDWPVPGVREEKVYAA